MSKYASSLANDAKGLNQDAANKANDTFNKIDDTIDTYARKANQTIDQLEGKAYDFAKSVGSFVQTQLSTNGKRVMEAKEKSQETIQTHPFAATAVAFVGGWILSALLSNSGRK